LLQWHPNIWVSTEGTTALITKAPRKFAEIIGTLMAAGAAERILWAVGGAVVHSRLLEEAFWRFEMPRDLIEQYGLPDITDDVKRNMLGLNAARLLGLDLDAVTRQINADEFAKPRELAEPWSSLRHEAVAG
jgi:predicted TIM-barrel fold metal-dependent hydrolase